MSLAPADWVDHHARIKPTAPALRNFDDGEMRTWKELEQRVGRLAYGLRHELGLGEGERVVSLTNGDLRCLELQFACMRAGLLFVPLNFRLTVAELAALCRDVTPGLMVTDDAWSTLAHQVCAEAGIGRIISWSGSGADFERLALQPRHLPANLNMRWDSATHILFTSGTTAKPKGAVCTHNTLLWQALNQVQLARVSDEAAHVFTSMPLFHAGGLNVLINPILFFGGQITVSARFDVAPTVRYIIDPANGVTHMAMISLMYDLMAQTPEFAGADLSHVRTAICGGARLTSALHKRYADKHLLLMSQYGGTETGPTITAIDPQRVDKVLAGSCGQKVMHTEIRLVKDDGSDAPQGEFGEVWVRGGAITPRYYLAGQPSLDGEGWFHTGDVARVDDEGFYYIVDRLKDMYKSGGENVSTQEVELVLVEHPAVAEVAVIGVPHEKWNEVGLAVVVAAAGQEVTLETLTLACEGKLARYKHPKYIRVVDNLPRNVTGKVAKDSLRKQYAEAKWP